jgi:hypothetical protein
MPEYTAQDIVLNAAQQNSLEVERAVQQIMADKVADLLASKKIELAKGMFDTDDTETTLNSSEETLEDEEFEMADEDFEEFEDDEQEEPSTEEEEITDENA